MTDPLAPQTYPLRKRIGLFAGPIAFALALWLLPHSYLAYSETGEAVAVGFGWAGRATLAVMLWMAIWWMSEAIDVSATALLPILLFPILQISTIDAACAPYADPLIFLYLGGFVIALSMERWGLGRRLALWTLRRIGTSAPRMLAGCMLVTAVLSAFVSNTATAAMMLPIALSLIRLVGGNDNPAVAAASRNFAPCLLLGIAYAASIGGIATIIGTPTNAFVVGFIDKSIDPAYRRQISFVSWLPIGVSFVVAFLPLSYLLLSRLLFPLRGIEIAGGGQLIDGELRSLGPVNTGERNILAVFLLAVLLWLTRPWLIRVELSVAGGEPVALLRELTDPGIAMLAALLLFVLPTGRGGRFTADWETLRNIPWGILILFGGGLSLAAAIQSSGVAEFLGGQTSRLAGLPSWAILTAVVIAVVFLTELTSNFATTASLTPVLAAVAPGLGLHPYELIIPAGIAASCAFMLPVATPPNAIVFGSGEIEMPQMIRAGFWLNWSAVIVLVLLSHFVIRWQFGL